MKKLKSPISRHQLKTVLYALTVFSYIGVGLLVRDILKIGSVIEERIGYYGEKHIAYHETIFKNKQHEYIAIITLFAIGTVCLFFARGKHHGTVKSFYDQKGYGFITPDDGSPDLYVHHTSIKMEGFRRLEEGRKVVYEVNDTPKGPVAINVRQI
ncbi:MAG: cold shock domain-containing protein [Candidatus Latescibacteria bacterium]|nr:cold shock domain-containing protein [Candidatus Latescibacterota bacterium]